jgi:hypothetical protein
VVDGDSDQDDIIQDLVWEDMNNYKGQRENFTGTSRCCKPSDRNCRLFKLFFNGGSAGKIVEETNRYAKHSYRDVNYPASHLLGHGNL